MNHVRTIDKSQPPSREAQLRKDWGASLREAMEEWVDPATTLPGMTVKRLRAELESRYKLVVSEQAIYGWLKGEYSPRRVHQAAVAAILEVKVRHLFPPLEMGA